MEKMKTVAYVRVSTNKQVDRGMSLEAQQEKMAAYAMLYDLELVETIVERGLSAKSVSGRPGLVKALKMLEDGEAEGLLVVKLDRLTRSIVDLGHLIEEYFGHTKGAKGARLMSVSEQIDTTSASGKLVLNVLMSVSQWEREVISERTSEVMQYKKSRGELVGSVPYGMKVGQDGKTLEPDEAEQEVLAYMKDLRYMGMSYRKIAGRLRAENVPSRQKLGSDKPGQWQPTSVHRLLRNEEVHEIH